MKIERVIPNPTPEFHIILSEKENTKLMNSAFMIKDDQAWSREYREFFGALFENRATV